MALFPGDETPPSAPASPTLLLSHSSGTHLLVITPPALVEVAEQLAAAAAFAFDTETTGIDPQQAAIVGLSVAWGREDNQSAYIPLGHIDMPGLPWEAVRAALQPAFADGKIAKIADNASYDMSILDRHDVAVAGDLIDTMIAAWLIDPGSHGLGLKDQAWTRLKVEMTPIQELIGSGKSQITMDRVPGGDGRGLRQRGCGDDVAPGRCPAA